MDGTWWLIHWSGGSADDPRLRSVVAEAVHFNGTSGCRADVDHRSGHRHRDQPLSGGYIGTRDDADVHSEDRWSGGGDAVCDAVDDQDSGEVYAGAVQLHCVWDVLGLDFRQRRK